MRTSNKKMDFKYSSTSLKNNIKFFLPSLKLKINKNTFKVVTWIVESIQLITNFTFKLEWARQSKNIKISTC